jgi:hypothetical protein
MIWQRIRGMVRWLWGVVRQNRYKLAAFVLLTGAFLVFRREVLRAIVSIGQMLGLRQPDPRILLLVGLALALVLMLWLIPKWQVRSVSSDPIERFKQANEARKTLAQIIGGLAFLGTLYFTSETLRTTQEGQVTDRFTKAIAQLGDQKLELRLGGIYALERIAKDSEKDYGPVMEILTAYVREGSQRKGGGQGEQARSTASNRTAAIGREKEPPKPPVDIQAVLTVLGRRIAPPEETRLNLSGSNLAGANFRQANLQKADLWKANLQGALFRQANLQGAYLWQANLQEAFLYDANLQGANLREANLQRADLLYTNLRGADLGGADLGGVENLTKEQVASARIDADTKLPDYLQPPQPAKP